MKFCLVKFHLVKFYFVRFHLVRFHLVRFHLVKFHFVKFYSVKFTFSEDLMYLIYSSKMLYNTFPKTQQNPFITGLYYKTFHGSIKCWFRKLVSLQLTATFIQVQHFLARPGGHIMRSTLCMPLFYQSFQCLVMRLSTQSAIVSMTLLPLCVFAKILEN